MPIKKNKVMLSPKSFHLYTTCGDVVGLCMSAHYCVCKHVCVFDDVQDPSCFAFKIEGKMIR